MRFKTSFPYAFIAIIILSVSAFFVIKGTNYWKLNRQIAQYAGSKSCLPCHEKFYKLWAPSFHGLAMQPVNKNFISDNIQVMAASVSVGQSLFEINANSDKLLFNEVTTEGDTNTYKAVHVMGGKYVYYFLTEFDKGRLHVLPVAYDCNENLWYNNPESGVRHFENIEDKALDWKSYLYTFNTSCYNCHVSQLESNFDLETLEYTSKWREPGINCETCHGPSMEHIRVCVKAGKNKIPEDLKIIRVSEFTQDQNNSSCGSCHGKSSVIASGFKPGDQYYDYFNLITLEHPDFYPDGRDLGENYTMTGWEMNKCKTGGQLHCVSCHTSSGRYKFTDENPNMACAPCHSDKVNKPSAHTFHKEDGEGSICISCHMPKTSFARMNRSDHSFRPPMPGATIEFGSPNACNICHSDRSAEWANNDIKLKNGLDYQLTTIKTGKLIEDARSGQWLMLEDIIDGLNNETFDPVFTTSFIRLLENCDDNKKWDALLRKTDDQSPLVRSAAVHALYGNNSKESIEVLIQKTGDKSRLVRLNAAYALSSKPGVLEIYGNNQQLLEAFKEYEASLISRNDDWASYYNLGNFYTNIGDNFKALETYLNSIRINPEAIFPMINAGFIYSLYGNLSEAEKMFELALSYSPESEAALLNLALLYGESGREDLAIDYFRKLLLVSDDNATAAFNLSVLLNDRNPGESLGLIRRAYLLDRENEKYLYTYAFYLSKDGSYDEAISVLNELINKNPLYIDAYLLIADIYLRKGDNNSAIEILEDAINSQLFGEEETQKFRNILSSLSSRIRELP